MKNWRSWILPTGFFGWCNQCSPNLVEFGQIACLPFDLHFKITFDKIEIISLLKFKFSQILLGDKNATSLCSKIISTLYEVYVKSSFPSNQFCYLFSLFKCQPNPFGHNILQSVLTLQSIPNVENGLGLYLFWFHKPL